MSIIELTLAIVPLPEKATTDKKSDIDKYNTKKYPQMRVFFLFDYCTLAFHRIKKLVISFCCL